MNNLFFKNIFNKNIKTVSKNLKHNVTLSVEDVFTDSRFFVDDSCDILRIIPLFVCENINSSNKVDKVVEGMIICENNPSTILNFNQGIKELPNDYNKTISIIPTINTSVELHTSFTYTVSLLNYDRTPLPNKLVRIYLIDSLNHETNYSNYTNDDGEITFSHIFEKEGEYKIMAYFDGDDFNRNSFGGGMITVEPDTSGYATHDELDVIIDDIDDMRINKVNESELSSYYTKSEIHDLIGDL